MRSKPIRRMMLGVLGALALWLAPHANAQCHYEVTVVTGPSCGVLGPASVHFFGINEHGQVCGRRSVCNVSGPSQWLPIVWTEEQGMIVLPLPEGATQGEANDINDVLGSDGFGQVACTLMFPGEGSRASLYDDGAWTILEPEGDGSHTEAFAINDDGWIAGYRDTDSGRFAIRWRGEQVLTVSSPIGGSAIARDINTSFDATGGFGPLTTNGLGFLWERDSTSLIPPVDGGISSEGRGLNRDSVVTGQSLIQVKSGSVPRRSWIYQNGRITDLGVFPNASHRNIAEDINDAGQIVGSCFALFGGATPYLWQDGELINLRDFFEMPPGAGNLGNVYAINNRGQIAGTASIRGIILTPIALLGDVNLDCQVNGEDLALVLADWGPCAQTGSCLCDIVTSSTFQPPGDNVVDGADLAVVLGNWTDAGSSSAASRRR